MKVLIYNDSNSGSGNTLWNASTSELEAAAYLALFRMFDGLAYYDVGDMSSREAAWYEQAKAGNTDAARHLLEQRKRQHHEYEDSWEVIEVLNPQEPKFLWPATT